MEDHFSSDSYPVNPVDPIDPVKETPCPLRVLHVSVVSLCGSLSPFRTFATVAALALVGGFAWRAAAEPRERAPGAPRADSRPRYQFRSQFDAGPKIEAERKALDRLATAKKWDEWLRRYQRLLDEHPDGLLAAGEERLVGLRRSLTERFRALPAIARDRYRQQYDGAAAAALSAAVERDEPLEVNRVYGRFRFTSAGPRAMAWLAERALDGGDSERAWLGFSRLIADAAGTEPELATWMAKAVMAGELSGRRSEAAMLAERLSEQHGEQTLKIGGQGVTARDWVRARRGDRTSGRSERAPEVEAVPETPWPSGDWPDFAGAADGLRVMTGSTGLQVRQAWQDVVPDAALGLQDYYDGRRPRFGVVGRYPGVTRFSHLSFATMVDGRVYAQAPGTIRCVSLADGQVIWKAREADLAPQRRFPTPGGFRWWRPRRATQTVAVAAGRLLLVRVPAGQYENDTSGWPAEFVLAALDARTGALLWQRAAANGPPDSFYNLPTVSGQTVYTGVSTAVAGLTEYRAAALDAATGDRLWTTFLGSGSDPMAGADGSPAAVRGGIVWVETCLHTLAALDSLTGEVIWVAPFQPDTAAPERSGWQDTMNVTNEPVSLIAPTSDRVLFSPRWGRELVSLNARTGHRAWGIDSGKSGVLFAVDQDRALLAGEQIRSVDPFTGRPQWTWSPPDRERLGYPALVGRQIVVPLGSSVVFLDAASGAERGRLSLKEFGAEPGAATVLVLGRRLIFSQPDRLIAVDESPDDVLARR